MDPPILNLSTRRRTVARFIAPHLFTSKESYLFTFCLRAWLWSRQYLRCWDSKLRSTVVETIIITPTKDYFSFADRFWQQFQLRLTAFGKQANKQIGLWIACVLMEHKNKQTKKKNPLANILGLELRFLPLNMSEATTLYLRILFVSVASRLSSANWLKSLSTLPNCSSKVLIR